MALFGQDRLEEIKKVERRLSVALRDLTIRNAGNLSYFEVYAAAVRAVEGIARAPAEEIRELARKVSAECNLDKRFGTDLYRQSRDLCVQKRLAEALRDLEQYLRDTPHHNAPQAAHARAVLAESPLSPLAHCRRNENDE